MAVILLRHTEPDIGAGVCYGRLDVGLVSGFVQQARRAAAALPPVDHLVSSPLTRCRRLADYLADRYAVSAQEDPRLMEMDFGRWEGRAWDDVPRAELDAWAADFLAAKPHGGESVDDMQRRVSAAIRDYERMPGTVLLVTHLGVIRCAFADRSQPDAPKASSASSAPKAASAYEMKIPYGGSIPLT